MAQAQPSMQELIRQRSRAGFVGRGAERAAFRENLELPPQDERHRFLFHVHGQAGVGKSFLLRELEQLAREKGALTASVDESVGSVPEVMAAISRRFAAQGHRFKDLDRALATHRERRHEAEAAAAALGPEPEGPSAAGTAVMRAGLVGLGMVPGIGPFAGALDAGQLAQSADRLRAGLSARFRSQDDVQLVLSPERVLTPVLLTELSGAAEHAPWIVLFLDTYERTGPFLDGWLHDVMTSDRYGALPATVVVVTAGQHPFDTARWGGFTDFMTDIPLGPFTETEARGLLADRGVVAEPVVEEVLRLTGGLPVLVSTLAEQRPARPDDIGDPSATAVERFLKWEQDPVRRAVALACALPRRVDMDVFRAAADCPDDDVEALFAWLRGLAFVDERGDRLRYHDLVREPMLRLQRRRSPRGWTERHDRLATVYGRWREEAGQGLGPFQLWLEEEWRDLRLEETYHALCARPRSALNEVLWDVVQVCGADEAAGRRWAQMLVEAGEATGDAALGDWGAALAEALADDATAMTAVADLILSRPGPDRRTRAAAHAFRARELRHEGRYERALADADRAVELDPGLSGAHYGRGLALRALGDFPAALAALDTADRLTPDDEFVISERAETYRLAGRHEEAFADYDRAVALDPADPEYLAGRAVSRQELGQLDEALADLDRAVALDEDYLWPLVRRARLRRVRSEWDEAFADYDRAVEKAPDSSWVASERGDAYRLAGRFEDAVAELGRAVALQPDHASALAGRGLAQYALGRDEEALADLSRAVGLVPDYTWALVTRAQVKARTGDQEGRFDDLRRAAATDTSDGWAAAELGEAYRQEGRYEEARAALEQSLAQDPEYDYAHTTLGAVHQALDDHRAAYRCFGRALETGDDAGWVRAQRARAAMELGWCEEALADLDRCVALDWEPVWARRTAIDLLVLCERWDEVEDRLRAAEAAGLPDGELDDLRAEWHAHREEWEEARRCAERLREPEPLECAFQTALVTSLADGLPAAEPLWRELAGMLETDTRLEETQHAQGHCFLGCVLGDWALADRGLTAFLAREPGWADTATLAAILGHVLRSPGADAAQLAPRLERVTAAAEAIRARHRR
ncbi:tetratricopeptide repeat protein [Streptomyces sp. SS1-1]|nr:tetratricopeptide repeat protein [Streptomyces sp. SS1-1]KAB2973306.1 tetratricopeptide repeat protein [Streptomyces sp. SS1-1]